MPLGALSSTPLTAVSAGFGTEEYKYVATALTDPQTAAMAAVVRPRWSEAAAAAEQGLGLACQ